MIWALLGLLIASLLGGSAGQPVKSAADALRDRIKEQVGDEIRRGRADGDVERFLSALVPIASKNAAQEQELLDALRSRQTPRSTLDGILTDIDETRRLLQTTTLDLQFDLRRSLNEADWRRVFVRGQ